MEQLRKLLVGFMVLLVLVGLWGAYPLPSQAQQPGQNLLVNPGFEGPYSGGVANGWAPWHEDSGDKCVSRPSDWDFVCMPSWSEEGDYSNLGLKRSGLSQHVGAQFTTWHGGVFQTVSAPPGSKVRFSVFGYGRASDQQPPTPSLGSNWIPRMRVGIDPQGKGLWYDGGVIWSGEVNTSDSWQNLSIEATVGASGKVTVFVDNKFKTVQPVAHMDVWWDDAALTVVGAAGTPTSAPPPPQPTATYGPPPTPRSTPTPRPDGAIVHVVVAGDTLGGIAYQYNVSVDQIRQLNGIGADNLIVVGQELVVSAPNGAPAATQTPQPQPTAQVPAGSTPQPTPGGAPTQPPAGVTPQPGAQGNNVCLLAFNDRNADTFRQADSEELIPGVIFTIGNAAGVVGQYTSNGFDEPHCMPNLANGTYRVSIQAPTGYAVSGAPDLALALTGMPIDAAFGVKRSDAAPAQLTPGPGSTTTLEPVETEDDGDSALDVVNLIVKISMGVVVLLLIVIAVLFFRARMR